MNFKVILFGFIIIVSLSVPVFSHGDWIPQKIEPTKQEVASGFTLSNGSLVVFENGKRIWSDLINMQYIGQLSSDPDHPYLIFSGRGCDACDENIYIFILNPKDDSFRTASKTKRYIFPGNLYAFGPGKRLIRESRLFVGDCFPGYNSIAI
jgi:hypothetical protein